MDWRRSVFIGLFFVGAGVLYYVTQGTGATIDLAGVIMLLLAGVSMTFGFAVLVKGSRDL